MTDKKLVRVVGNIFGITLAVDPDVPPDEARFYVDGERAGTIIDLAPPVQTPFVSSGTATTSASLPPEP